MPHLFIHEYVSNTLESYEKKFWSQFAEQLKAVLLKEVNSLSWKEDWTIEPSQITSLEEVEPALLEKAVKNVWNDLRTVLADLDKMLI